MKRFLLIVLCAGWVFTSNANGQPADAAQAVGSSADVSPAPQAAPAGGETPAPAEQIQVNVTAVQGTVQVRASEDAPWVAAQPGMVLGPGAEFRTMLRSAVRFEIPPGQTITLTQLGTITVLQAIQQAEGKYQTDVGLKYGRVRYDVQAAGVEHQSTIRSPGSTLAIRGTGVNYEDRADQMPVMVVVDNGTADFKRQMGSLVRVGKRNRTARMRADDQSAAATATREGRLNPRTDYAGQTDTELNVLESQPLIAGDLLRAQGVEGFHQAARAESVARDIMDSGTPGEGMPGIDPTSFGLAFLATWSGSGTRGSDVDLSIRSPAEEPVLTAQNQTVPSGGRHFGDFRATSSSGFSGGELAAWLTQDFPGGIFDVILTLNNLSAGVASDPVSFELRAFSVMGERGLIQIGPIGGTLSPSSPQQIIPIDTREFNGGYGQGYGMYSSMPK